MFPAQNHGRFPCSRGGASHAIPRNPCCRCLARPSMFMKQFSGSFRIPVRGAPLRLSRSLLCRFVSLLPFQRRPSVGEQRVQSWNSPHAFLAAGRGDASDHALLLCSLLLGFGLDAFVCVGHVHRSDAEGGERELMGHGGGYAGREPGLREEIGHMVRICVCGCGSVVIRV